METRIEIVGTARTLCTPSVCQQMPALAQDAWLQAKETQGCPIGAAQLSRLEAMPSHYPQLIPSSDAKFAEVVRIHGTSNSSQASRRKTAAEIARIGQRNGLVRKLSRMARSDGNDAA